VEFGLADVALGGGFFYLLRPVLVWEKIAESECFLILILTQNRRLGI
jgi:hypothetical protein